MSVEKAKRELWRFHLYHSVIDLDPFSSLQSTQPIRLPKGVAFRASCWCLHHKNIKKPSIHFSACTTQQQNCIEAILCVQRKTKNNACTRWYTKRWEKTERRKSQLGNKFPLFMRRSISAFSWCDRMKSSGKFWGVNCDFRKKKKYFQNCVVFNSPHRTFHVKDNRLTLHLSCNYHSKTEQRKVFRRAAKVLFQQIFITSGKAQKHHEKFSPSVGNWTNTVAWRENFNYSCIRDLLSVDGQKWWLHKGREKERFVIFHFVHKIFLMICTWT